MTTLLSPGIQTREINLSATIGQAATGRAAMVGKFSWGPAYQVTQVASETQLSNVFGTSNDYTFASFMTANNFLKYANDLRIVRIVDATTAKNSTAIANAIDYTIGSAVQSGYAVGDTIEVLFGGDVVNTGQLGEVTAIGPNGVVTEVFIPSGLILQDKAARNESDLSGYTVNVSTSSGGSGASITLAEVPNSLLYSPNRDSAPEALTDPTANGFNAVSRKLQFPIMGAAYPGAAGDNISVYIANKADFDASITPAAGQTANGDVTLPIYPDGGTITVNFRQQFPFGPANNNQYAVIVQSGTSIVESYILSTNPSDRNATNETIYIDEFFDNGGSEYIYAVAQAWQTRSAAYRLAGGVDNTADAADWTNGWDLLSDPETVYTNLLIAGNVADETAAIASTVQKYAVGIADARSDALVFVSPPKNLVINKTVGTAVDNMVAWRRGRDSQGQVVDDNMNISSTYTSIDGNYKYQYDKFSDRNRWVPLAGDIAGLCANTDRVAQPWFSPAGLVRGQIRDVIKLAVDTRQSHRDRLYELAINPVVSLSGVGTVLYGDKTATLQSSAFDRINVRRLFNLIKKAIGDAARFRLFELNDTFTRSSFKSELDAYLDNIRALNGIFDFRVICDETNNTPALIDRNEFVASIYVKPARSINFITLNFIATSTGANFDEIIGGVVN